MSDDNALFGFGNAPDSQEEIEVQAYIDSLAAKAELSPFQKVTARMCLALAKSIAEGNRKGRSVANDAERLMATMRELSGEEAASAEDLTQAEKDLLNALSTPPGSRPAEDGYTS